MNFAQRYTACVLKTRPCMTFARGEGGVSIVIGSVLRLVRLAVFVAWTPLRRSTLPVYSPRFPRSLHRGSLRYSRATHSQVTLALAQKLCGQRGNCHWTGELLGYTGTSVYSPRNCHNATHMTSNGLVRQYARGCVTPMEVPICGGLWQCQLKPVAWAEARGGGKAHGKQAQVRDENLNPQAPNHTHPARSKILPSSV